jgi:hypothetical protein
MLTNTCAIWGTPADQRPITGGFRVLNSPRAGGVYIVTGSVENFVASASVKQKRAITRWLIRQRSFGIVEPRLDSHTAEQAASYPSLSFTEKVNSVLQYFGSYFDRMDSGFKFTYSNEPDDRVNALIAISDSTDSRELAALLRTIVNMGMITANESATINAIMYFLTPMGWERVENFNTKVVASHQAFVAMWFNPSMMEAYSDGFAPAITASGYKPFRIDKKEHVNKIDDEIVAEIRRSRFLISDFTCEPEKPRGGVYFEAGFAMGIGIPVIWTCKENSINDLHFDTRQYNHIVWKDVTDLNSQLTNRIGAVIGGGPFKTTTGA